MGVPGSQRKALGNISNVRGQAVSRIKGPMVSATTAERKPLAVARGPSVPEPEYMAPSEELPTDPDRLRERMDKSFFGFLERCHAADHNATVALPMEAEPSFATEEMPEMPGADLKRDNFNFNF
ncbi:uncharacterized protein MONBRDRAFT_5342 [Monosiga brevicollis MX1]|uniref:Uncharacterized protein n=1 Tax=Monosiga brevicollis TaxID=81824 RepID=A9UQP3_MONBE|nr:uncharacterized protein MONBRDRAFT_5342 [Monosiga brevicollis MX1]EDQ92634.1 predicted protein [Monosiga brevicollis MX1]|eukprot:XP_001742396.1 hypothetical protein [Monosiga brevicollis MX1]